MTNSLMPLTPRPPPALTSYPLRFVFNTLTTEDAV
jgi:hypothetical protein